MTSDKALSGDVWVANDAERIPATTTHCKALPGASASSLSQQRHISARQPSAPVGAPPLEKGGFDAS